MPEFQEFARLGPDMMTAVSHVIACAFVLVVVLMAFGKRGAF